MLLGSNPMKARALDAPEHAPPHSLDTTALEAAMGSSVVFYES